jgi:hypothetical protein
MGNKSTHNKGSKVVAPPKILKITEKAFVPPKVPKKPLPKSSN